MRLIDIDAVRLPKGFFEKVDNVPKFYEWLNEQPIVNAVEVVRCKECKHFPVGREEEGEYGWVTWPRDEYGFIDKVCPYYCEDNYYSKMPSKNGFCHEGEKKRWKFKMQ